MNKNVVNPIGLKGNQQLQHIQELMHKLTPINEEVKNSVVELTKKAADGKIYAIVRENHNYFIKIATQKKGPLVTEDFQYIGGLQNKSDESHPTYAKALKRLNGKLISIAEQYNSTNHINTFLSENLCEDESDYLGEASEEVQVESETDETDETENTDECSECDDDKGPKYNFESRASSIAKSLTEDDNGYCNSFILPKGIENFFESLDDIKKKV